MLISTASFLGPYRLLPREFLSKQVGGIFGKWFIQWDHVIYAESLTPTIFGQGLIFVFHY